VRVRGFAAGSATAAVPFFGFNGRSWSFSIPEHVLNGPLQFLLEHSIQLALVLSIAQLKKQFLLPQFTISAKQLPQGAEREGYFSTSFSTVFEPLPCDETAASLIALAKS
jgi:hypothetical protein